MNGNFFESNDVVIGLTPVNMGAANNGGKWSDVRGFERVAILLVKGAGTAGQDPQFEVHQARTATGTGRADFDFTRVYTKTGTTANGGDWSVVNQAASHTYQDDESAEVIGIIGVDVETNMLRDGYHYIRIEVPDTGAASQLGAAIYIGYNPRHSGAALPNL